MSKGSKRLSAPWVGAALLGAGVVSAGACGGIADDDDLFNSGATSGVTGTGGADSTSTSTSSTPSTTGTSTGQGGDSSTTTTGMGPGGASGSTTTTTTTASSTSSGGPVCGNGIKEGGEACDGAQLGGQSCTTLGYSKGDGLKCTVCQLDGAGCKSTCGDGKLEPNEACDDGNTTPGDGCDATCQVEVVVGTTCANAIPIAIGLGSQDVMGTTVGGGAHTAAGCTSAASDRVYAVTATANGFLTANLVRSQTSFDSVLYLASPCTDSNPMQDVLCNDSHDPQNQAVLNGGEVVSVRVQKNQTYILVVDGAAAASAGTYKLHLDLSLGSDCGDPVPIPLEAGTGMTVLGSTTGINANVQGSCGGSTTGAQVVYAVTRAASGSIDAATVTGSTNYNTVLYARTACSGGNTEIDCSSTNGGNGIESVTIPNAVGGTPVFVWVDGTFFGGGNSSGNYGVTLTP